MGGKAFTSGPSPLSTPRLPKELYLHLRDHYHHLLRDLYRRVASPIEAPEKSSYGDIDILVAEPLKELPTREALSAHLQAVRSFVNHSSHTTSFAVPYPECADRYVQIDVQLCLEDTFEWHMFHHSHGDLWNLLGTTIRPFGLTANDKGMHLRIREIEPLDKKKSLLFLTKEPQDVVRFLGLDLAQYEAAFDSIEALYQFVTSCRFFNPTNYPKNGLKANDKKRMAQRGVYRKFVEDWIPRRYGVESGQPLALPTREEVAEEALNRFGKLAEHEARLGDWRKERKDLLIKQITRTDRKRAWAEVGEYADAWMLWLSANN